MKIQCTKCESILDIAEILLQEIQGGYVCHRCQRTQNAEQIGSIVAGVLYEHPIKTYSGRLRVSDVVIRVAQALNSHIEEVKQQVYAAIVEFGPNGESDIEFLRRARAQQKEAH